MPTRVFLGHLSRDASDRDIERLFKNYGNIREVTLKNGFGFVDFDNSKDAEDVVNDFHGKPFLSERLVVEIAHNERRGDERRNDRFGPPERTAHRLMVENLAHGVSWQDMKDMMRKAGVVTYADLSKDQDNQGVVEFQTEADVQNALKTLDGELLRGRPVSLRLFDPSRDTVPRVGGGGGGGGRDRGRERERHRGDRYIRNRGYSRERGYSRDRDRRRSRSRSRSHSRGHRGESREHRSDRNRKREKDRDHERNRDGRGSRQSPSPAPRSRSPIGRRRVRSRSGSRN